MAGTRRFVGRGIARWAGFRGVPVRRANTQPASLQNSSARVTRYRYNQQVSPPGPFVHVALQRPVGDETISDLPAQLDTAADLTVVPLSLIEQLGLLPFDVLPVLGFGGVLSNVPTFLVRLSIRGEDPVPIEVLGNAEEPTSCLAATS